MFQARRSFAEASCTVADRVIKTADSVAAGYQLRVKTTARGGLCDPDVHQVSGYLDVANGDHIFFWSVHLPFRRG